MTAEVDLSHAVETLRVEYYRIVAHERSVPEELWAARYGGNEARQQQRQIVEALLILGADVTADMQALRVAR